MEDTGWNMCPYPKADERTMFNILMWSLLVEGIHRCNRNDVLDDQR